MRYSHYYFNTPCKLAFKVSAISQRHVGSHDSIMFWDTNPDVRHQILTAYFCWTGLFWLESSSHFPHSLSVTSTVLCIRSVACLCSCQTPRVTGLHSPAKSHSQMSPFNMLMSWASVEPLGKKMSLLDRCVCVCGCDSVCACQYTVWFIHFHTNV